MPGFIDANNVNASIFAHFCLQLEFCDEIRYHFEVHDTERKIDKIFGYVNVSLHLRLRIEIEQRKRTSHNHSDLHAEKNGSIDYFEVARI